jgi:RNA 2',3'-cyclic 3'-phosphodiesterase
MRPLSIAIPLPPNIKTQLQRLCFGLPSIQWVGEENFYLILNCLGSVDGALYLDIKEKLAEVHHPSFLLSIEGIGCSQAKGSRGVIWAGVSSSESLKSLKKTVDAILKTLPMTLQSRQFSPHVILARYEKINVQRLGAYLEAHAAFTSPQFAVEAFVIISRQITQKHTFYIEEDRYLLSVTL